MKSRTTICWSWETLGLCQSQEVNAEGKVYIPDNSRAVELDVEDVAVVQSFELADYLPGLDVPDFDATIVATADKTTAERVIRQGADEHGVASECAEAFPSGRTPDLDLAVVRARHDEVILQSRHEGEWNDRTRQRTLNSMQANPRSWASNVRMRSPLVMSHRIILPSPLALANRFPWTPTALTGPSCPRNAQCNVSVVRFHTSTEASFPLNILHKHMP